jgi:hypothetical protein
MGHQSIDKFSADGFEIRFRLRTDNLDPESLRVKADGHRH